MIARSVITLFSYGALWHHGPKNYYKVRENVKITGKCRELYQIIRSGFRKKYRIIGKPDQIGEGQIGQFSFRGDSWPNCPIKCEKLKFWNIELNWRSYGRTKEKKWKLK